MQDNFMDQEDHNQADINLTEWMIRHDIRIVLLKRLWTGKKLSQRLEQRAIAQDVINMMTDAT